MEFWENSPAKYFLKLSAGVYVFLIITRVITVYLASSISILQLFSRMARSLAMA
jgi:hypothetical protein